MLWLGYPQPFTPFPFISSTKRIQKTTTLTSPGFLVSGLTIRSSSGRWNSGRSHWEEFWEHYVRDSRLAVSSVLWLPSFHLKHRLKAERCSSAVVTMRPRPHSREVRAARRNSGADGISELLSSLTFPRLLVREDKGLIWLSFGCSIAHRQTQSNWYT